MLLLRSGRIHGRHPEPGSTRRGWPIAAVVFSLLFTVAVLGCGPSKSPDNTTPAASPAAAPAVPAESRSAPSPSRMPPFPGRDLSADEASGGHTLARHVGKTDDELRERLRREPDISSASTYTDRATAEAVVGAALLSPPRSFAAWRNRAGSRPNFVLHFDAHRVIGRSVGRRRPDAVPCENALIVLRWDVRRERFFVLTSYPEDRH